MKNRAYTNDPDLAARFNTIRAREERRASIVVWTLAALGVIALCWAYTGEARAHQAPTGWAYPLYCCSNKDCTMVDSERVKERPDGYHVTLLPGDHEFVKEKISYVIPYGKEKPSPDGAYHICINPSLKMLCFFAGARMF